tara:strand:+ start:571 stop:711 length:141 start_codon:yes stop_codon:yes gene_type:complete
MLLTAGLMGKSWVGESALEEYVFWVVILTIFTIFYKIYQKFFQKKS